MKTTSTIITITGLCIALSTGLQGQQKITDRASLAAVALAPATDVLGIVDVSAGLSGSKQITINELFTGWGFTAAGEALAKAATAADQRTAMGLGSAATTASTAYEAALGNPASNGYVLSSTTSGTRSWVAAGAGTGDLVSTNNLSDVASASTARTNLGVAIGSNVQAWDADLDTWAGKTAPSGAVVGTSDTQTLTNKTLTTPVINAGSDATGDLYYRSAGGAFTRLGIGSSGQFLKVDSGLPSWADLTGGGDMLASNNLSDLASASTARTNLGLAIGSNVQAWDADLDAWAGKTAPSGAVVGISDTQTLTSKTLTSPVINAGSDATGDLYYRSAGGAFTRLGIGSSAQVLTVSGGLPSWAAAAGGGALTNFTEAAVSASPNASTPVSVLTAVTGGSNADLALVAKGSGSIMVSVPNNSASGGNKRGLYAVDLQSARSSNTQVASNSYSVIVGGQSNTASGQNSIAGGSSSTASGSTTVAFGNSVTVDGFNAVGLGSNVTASGDYSTGFGRYSHTQGRLGMLAHTSGRFSSFGDAQAGRYVLLKSTSNATITEMSLGGGTPSAASRVVLLNNSAFAFRGQAIARSSDGDSKSWQFSGCIERGATAATTGLIGSITSSSTEEAGASSWVLTVDADTTNGSLRFQATGEASRDIRWVVSLTTAELGY